MRYGIRAGLAAALLLIGYGAAHAYLLLGAPAAAASGAYYVNASTGNDSNPGTQAQPWQTITRVNQGPTGGYTAGNTIYFAGGQTFTPSSTCSGTAGNLYFNTTATLPTVNISTSSPPTSASPLTVQSYGSGTATIVSSCPGTDQSSTLGPRSAALIIDGVSNFTWNGVNLSANGTTTQYGAVIEDSTLSGSISNVTFESSSVTGFHLDTSTSDASAEILIAPIPINVTTAQACTSMNTINITGNTVGGASGATSADDNGIESNAFMTSTTILCSGTLTPTTLPITNLTISGNTVSDLGARSALPDTFITHCCYGIEVEVADGATVSSNLVHDVGANLPNNQTNAGIGYYNAASLTISSNEIYNVDRPGGVSSGSTMAGISLSNGGYNITAEYNYTHGNNGPGIQLNVGAGNITQSGTRPITAEYNISENDDASFSTGFPSSIWINTNTGTYYIFNNTIYQSSPAGQCAISFNTTTSGTAAGYVANNVFAVGTDSGNTAFACDRNTTGHANISFLNDAFYAFGAGTFSATYAGTTYTSLSAWQAVIPGGEASATTAVPTWTGTPPVGTCSWTPANLGGPQPCPAAYKLGTGSAYIGTGLNLTQSPYSLTVGTQDYYGAAIGTGAGTGYSIGAAQ